MAKAPLLNAIIQNAIDGIITITKKGIVELINPSACRLFDYLPEEVIGKNISMLMQSPDKERHDTYLERYQQTGVPHVIGIGREVSGLKKGGSVFPFRLTVSEVQLADRIIFIGFIYDLTLQKEAEGQLKSYAMRLEEQVKERTWSLNSIVQQLRQAKEEVSLSLEKEKELGQLKSTIQSSALLIDKYILALDTAKVQKHVGKITNAVGNLTSILNEFLSLDKLEGGKVAPTISRFDLVKLAEDITEQMQMVAKQNQSIIYEHTGTDRIVNLDQNLLKNCILNLISNAIKYSGENTFIEFNTAVDKQKCTITIKDNGIGIPEPDGKHLFEAFFRAHNTGNIPGTGLGLNIVARYTRLMNGHVNFKSSVNHGTLFTLSFPAL